MGNGGGQIYRLLRGLARRRAVQQWGEERWRWRPRVRETFGWSEAIHITCRYTLAPRVLLSISAVNVSLSVSILYSAKVISSFFWCKERKNSEKCCEREDWNRQQEAWQACGQRSGRRLLRPCCWNTIKGRYLKTEAEVDRPCELSLLCNCHVDGPAFELDISSGE